MRIWDNQVMSNESAGAKIKLAREKKQWKPAILARAADLSPSRLSRLESGESHPSREEWSRLDAHLELGPYPILDRLELPPVRRRWFPNVPDLTAPERPLAARLHAARKLFGHAAERVISAMEGRADRAHCEKFLEDANLESGYECMFWLILLACGARPGRHSLLRAGFRKFAVVDPHSKEARGDVRFACLDVDIAGCECLLFPQVTLDTRKRIFRLDVLACLYTPRHRTWVNIELDGYGHDSTFDHERQHLLSLPTARFQTIDLSSPDLMAVLERKLKPLLGFAHAG